MKILFVSTGHVDDDSRLLKESAALQAAGHDVTILGLQELVDKRQDWAKEAVLMRQIYQKEFAWPLMQQRLRRIYASFETK